MEEAEVKNNDVINIGIHQVSKVVYEREMPVSNGDGTYFPVQNIRIYRNDGATTVVTLFSAKPKRIEFIKEH